ncbi:MAG: protein adenylyltransferase SelO family protein [Cyanobium sp. Prado107]|jgi:hypothetical protein|nr:protein adenylyltransferase SelO family protein [Cyanobium sp. Prado107]
MTRTSSTPPARGNPLLALPFEPAVEALGPEDWDVAEAAPITATLRRWNLPETPVRPVIERIWEAIDQRDDWQPLHDWLARAGLMAAGEGVPTGAAGRALHDSTHG